MASSYVPIRSHYAVATLAGLRDLGGTARPPEIFAWLDANGKVRDEDRTELPSGGPKWEKETRFAILMMTRAGLVDRSEYGVWRLTDAGKGVDLAPALAAALFEATDGRKLGGMTLERTYRAIRDAARARRFISYGQLAEANGVAWMSVRSVVPRMLGRLVTLAHARGWPMLSAIVVNKEHLETGALEGSARDGFLAAAAAIGIEPDDPAAFVREQQRLLFEWAATAPETLDAEGRGGSNDDIGDATPVIEAGEGPKVLEQMRQYWIAGAQWGGTDDQLDRFRAEGIWQSGDDEEAMLISQMRAGDRIAVKAAFVQKRHLPFDAAGESVSAMRIKATGTIVSNRNDGRTAEVRWDPPFESRDWYFYTFRKTLARLDPTDDRARRLIAFIFGGAEQDYDWWLRLPYFADKYARVHEPAIPLPDEPDRSDEPEDVADDAYTAASIVTEGCFLPEQEVAALLTALRAKRNLVLQGPPGTGKSWLAKRLGTALIGSTRVAGDRLRSVQFHPSMSYEDFVRGWRPESTGGLRLQDGIFLSAVEAALASPDPYVLVIEEINRGNPAQIFGEMLTLIEDSKRQKSEALEIAYPRSQGERIHVPENLYIIGTMNLADRSLALVDLALRRRFAFATLEPRFGEAWRAWSGARGGISNEILDLIQARIADLNQRIATDPALGVQFRVGHSYLTPDAPVADAREWYRRKVELEIVPLLEEYWFDQEAKVKDARAALLTDL